MLKMPVPMWMRSVVRPAMYGEERLVRRQVRVLVEEVVLGRPRVLEPGLVGRDGPVHLVHEPLVLGAPGRSSRQVLGQVQAVEDPEFHGCLHEI